MALVIGIFTWLHHRGGEGLRKRLARFTKIVARWHHIRLSRLAKVADRIPRRQIIVRMKHLRLANKALRRRLAIEGMLGRLANEGLLVLADKVLLEGLSDEGLLRRLANEGMLGRLADEALLGNASGETRHVIKL